MMHSKAFNKMAIYDLERKMIAQKRLRENMDELAQHAGGTFELFLSRKQVDGDAESEYSGEAAAMLMAMFTMAHEIADAMNLDSAEMAVLYEATFYTKSEEA